MIELTIEVEGMKCGMCESHVNDSIRRACFVKKLHRRTVRTERLLLRKIMWIDRQL